MRDSAVCSRILNDDWDQGTYMREDHARFLWWRDGANVVSALAIVAAVVVVRGQLMSVNEQLQAETEQRRAAAVAASASFVLQLSERFSHGRLRGIKDSVEYHGSGFSLRRHGFQASDIEDYISQLEDIGVAVRYGIVGHRMAYEEFSYDVEKAYCNADVQAALAEGRSADRGGLAPNAYYVNFTDLAKGFLTDDQKDCKDIDEE